MRLPAVPSDPSAEEKAQWLELIRLHPELVTPEPAGRYLHWEELRHRAPPYEISHEAWWWLVRFARTALAKSFPLPDPQGKRFIFAMTDSVQRAVHQVDRDASGQIELPEDVANRDTRDRYVVNSLIEEAIRSSQLEGASTTRAVAKEMLRTSRPPLTTGERMIVNNFRALEWAGEQRSVPLSPAGVLELHRIVTQDTLEVERGEGRFRRPDEEIVVHDHDGTVVHVPPPAETLPQRLEALCRFANDRGEEGPFIHPVVRAILVHFWLAYDHPFIDGNGRTARALFYWSMLNQGYWLTEFLSVSRVIRAARAQYDRAFLFAESDEGDATYFVLNQLTVVRRAIDDLHAYLRRKVQETRSIERVVQGRDDLNHRQLALLGHMLRNADAKVSIESHRASHRVVYQTARTDLLHLEKLGFLTQQRIGRRLYFRPAKDLSRRLKRKM